MIDVATESLQVEDEDPQAGLDPEDGSQALEGVWKISCLLGVADPQAGLDLEDAIYALERAANVGPYCCSYCKGSALTYGRFLEYHCRRGSMNVATT